MNVHRSFICNRQKLETSRCSSVGEWFNEVVHPYLRIVLSKGKKKRNELLIHVTAWVNLQTGCAEGKANPQRLHIMCFHLYTVLEMTKL